MLRCVLIRSTTSVQERGDDTVSFLDGVCPFIPIESLWDRVWQQTPGKLLLKWTIEVYREYDAGAGDHKSDDSKEDDMHLIDDKVCVLSVIL